MPTDDETLSTDAQTGKGHDPGGVVDSADDSDSSYDSDLDYDDVAVKITDHTSKSSPKQPKKQPKKQRSRKKSLTLNEDSDMLATRWIEFYNSITTGEKLTIPRLQTYLRKYNSLQKEAGRLMNVVKAATRDGHLYVETAKMLRAVRCIRELRIDTNEERKLNIAYTARRRALILETRAMEEANIWGSSTPPKDYDEFCELIAKAANHLLIADSSIRNSRNQYVFITAQEIKDFGIKKQTLTEVSGDGSLVETSNKFYASAKKRGEMDEEFKRILEALVNAANNSSTNGGLQQQQAANPRGRQ